MLCVAEFSNASSTFNYHLSKLTSNNSQWEQVGVCIGEEASWVSLDLSQLEANTSILSIGAVQSGGEGTSHAASADTLLVVTLRIGESKTGWA